MSFVNLYENSPLLKNYISYSVGFFYSASIVSSRGLIV